jgi:hypothetical protein
MSEHAATDQPFADELLEAWRGLWVNRTQPYARQQADGSYRWVYAPCDLAVLRGHLTGEHTIALSSTDARGWAKWACLDADAADALPQLVALRAALEEGFGIPSLVEASRRGGHLWRLLDAPVPAVALRFCLLRALAQLAEQGMALPALELYPDTSQAGALGHAVRLPLGVHRRTSRRYPLLDTRGMPYHAGAPEESVRLLLEAPRVSSTTVQAQWGAWARYGHSPSAGQPTHHLAPPVAAKAGEQVGQVEHLGQVGGMGLGTRSAVIRWVDAHVSPLAILDELAPAAEPRRMGQGYLGWCPFYDDRAPDAAGQPGTPSFYVVANARYGWSWRCLSAHCHWMQGPMQHSFRLFQELLHLDAAAAIRAACVRWPEAGGATPRAQRPS